MAEISEKSKSVLDYIKRAELSPKELGEVIGGVTVMAIGAAFNSAAEEMDR